MRTDELIERLASDAGPLKPLASPWRRTAAWLGLAGIFAAIMVFTMSPRPDLAERLEDSRYLIEQVAALLTAALAAHAALALSIPGTRRRIAMAPLFPAAVWIGAQGVGCVAALSTRSELRLTGEPECLVLIAVTGSLPSVVLIAMLRQGFPVRPRLSLALGILAAAAIGNVGLRFYHVQDAALMVLVWQTGSVALLSLGGWLLGRTLLHVKAAL